MQKIFLVLFSLLIYVSLLSQQKIAICENDKGCSIATVNLSKQQIDNEIGKPSFLTAAGTGAILVFTKCASTIEENKTPEEIHRFFGGAGTPASIQNFSIRKYLVDNNCVGCPNPVKKISFSVNSPEFNSSSFFFLNINAQEAYMSNEANQLFYKGEEGFDEIKYDAFFRANKLMTYLIDSEGKKWMSNMALGTGMEIKGMDDIANANYFKQHFKATGKKRSFLNTSDIEYEYTGLSEEGPINFWLGPAYDVCIANNDFASWAFFNLGYIAVDGITYLISEIAGSGVTMKVTGVENGSYSFNTAGYTPMGDAVASMQPNVNNQYKDLIEKLQQEVDKESDPQLKKLMREQLETVKKMAGETTNMLTNFSNTSNLSAISNELSAISQNFSSPELYLNQLQEGKRKMELEITELQKQGTNNNEAVSTIRCKIGCNNKAQQTTLKYINEEKRIKKQYDKNYDKREELLGNLYQQMVKELGIECECN